jgi:hypothetical protein
VIPKTPGNAVPRLTDLTNQHFRLGVGRSLLRLSSRSGIGRGEDVSASAAQRPARLCSPAGRSSWQGSLLSGFGFGEAGSLDGEVQPVAGDHHYYPGEPESPADQDVGQPLVSQEDPA